MDAKTFENALKATLSEAPDDYTSGDALNIESVRGVETYEDAGVLTTDAGLVVQMEDGSQFQISIVQSRRAR